MVCREGVGSQEVVVSKANEAIAQSSRPANGPERSLTDCRVFYLFICREFKRVAGH